MPVALYNVVVMRSSVSFKNREPGDWDIPAYKRVVRAENRTGALTACLKGIWAVVDGDVEVVSVYVGRKAFRGETTRLQPIQIKRGG